MDLVNEILNKQQELDISIKQLRKTGTAYAQAEKDYKVALRTEALKLRNEQDMAVTLINQIIYGVPKIADLRFKRDVAQAVHKANLEAINSIKLQLRLLNDQVSREFSTPSSS